jgi:hypothetical protein
MSSNAIDKRLKDFLSLVVEESLIDRRETKKAQEEDACGKRVLKWTDHLRNTR